MRGFSWPQQSLPKDCYTLPYIDQLVDSTTGHKFISMMDVYQMYHQIPLTKADQENVSFVTINETFSYVVMSFKLKNIRATYQWLMDKYLPRELDEMLKFISMTSLSSRLRRPIWYQTWRELLPRHGNTTWIEYGEVHLQGSKRQISGLHGNGVANRRQPKKDKGCSEYTITLECAGGSTMVGSNYSIISLHLLIGG